MTEQDSRRFWILAALTLVVLCVAYGPLFVDFFVMQWARPHYQYFPFVIGAFFWLLWQRSSQATPRQEVGRNQSLVGVAGWIVLAGAWFVLAFAYLADSPWLAYLSLIGVITSCFLGISRHWCVPYLWGVWLLPWLVLPLPFGRDQILIAMLQRGSSQVSSIVLDRFRVPHLMEGNALVLPDKRFFVDEACSGIISVMSIIACAVLYGVWRNRAPLHLLLLAVAGIGWATLMNVVRISVIAIAYDWSGVDWSKGTPHEILGLAIFLITFVALVSSDYALVVLLAPVREKYVLQYGDPMKFGLWLVSGWDWLQGWGRPALAGSWEQGAESATVESRGIEISGERRMASGKERGGESDTQKVKSQEPRFESQHWEFARRFVLGWVPLLLFGVLAGTQFAMADLFRQPAAGPSQSLARARALNAEMLPKSVSSFVQGEFSVVDRSEGDVFGDHSRSYEYHSDGGNNVLVSCDFPFGPGWHDLTTCYRGIGWELTSYRTTESSILAEEGEKWGLVEATFSKPDGTAAYLTYCVFDEHGMRLSPPMNQDLDSLWQVFLQQFGAQRPGRLFQVQVWTTAVGEVSEERRQAARELLLDARERFRKSVTESSGETIEG